MFQQVVISCGAKKADLFEGQFVEAYKLYEGSYFKQMLNLAIRLSPNVYILSAAYGLLELGDMVQTYDLKMNPSIAKWMRENKIVDFSGASLLGEVYAKANIGQTEQIIPTMGMGLKAQYAKKMAANLPILCNLEDVKPCPGFRNFVTPNKYWR